MDVEITEFFLFLLFLWTLFKVMVGNSANDGGPIVYTRDQLLAFRNMATLL